MWELVLNLQSVPYTHVETNLEATIMILKCHNRASSPGKELESNLIISINGVFEYKV